VGVLYGTDAKAGNLLNINPNDGSATVIGPTGLTSIPSLAIDPTSGTLFAGTGGTTGPLLYRLDPLTGGATLIGDTGLGDSGIGGMDIGPDGKLYAAVNLAGNGNTGSDHLAILDTDTGAATIIGPFGSCTDVVVPSVGGGSCTIEGIEGLAFDAGGGLWGSHSDRGPAGPPGLYSIDVATGQATFVTPIANAAGESPSGGVVSLQFQCGGLLYGGTARERLGFDDGGNLILIDPTSGNYVTLGDPVQEGSLGGLTFSDFCQPTQLEPRSWGEIKAHYR
jgi:hypothetical protein